jgi:hypothetical protein
LRRRDKGPAARPAILMHGLLDFEFDAFVLGFQRRPAAVQIGQ